MQGENNSPFIRFDLLRQKGGAVSRRSPLGATASSDCEVQFEDLTENVMGPSTRATFLLGGTSSASVLGVFSGEDPLDNRR